MIAKAVMFHSAQSSKDISDGRLHARQHLSVMTRATGGLVDLVSWCESAPGSLSGFTRMVDENVYILDGPWHSGAAMDLGCLPAYFRLFRLRRQHISNGVISIRTEKTGVTRIFQCSLDAAGVDRCRAHWRSGLSVYDAVNTFKGAARLLECGSQACRCWCRPSHG